MNRVKGFKLIFRIPPKSVEEKLKEMSFIPLEFHLPGQLQLPPAINSPKDKIKLAK